MCIASSLKAPKSVYRIYFYSLIFGGAILIIVSLRNLMILGAEGVARNYFPSYVAVSLIRIGEFIQRLELAVSTILLLNVFVKVSICLLAVCRGVEKLFNLQEYRFIVTPAALLMISFSTIVYGSIMETTKWAFSIWPYYAFLFQVILPVIILIGVEIKTKKAKLKVNA